MTMAISLKNATLKQTSSGELGRRHVEDGGVSHRCVCVCVLCLFWRWAYCVTALSDLIL